jgi:hypothetical protein
MPPWLTLREPKLRMTSLAPAADPLYQFNVNQSINQETAKIDGWEIGGQYFFGDSGFGLLANYTMVNGDVGFDVTAPTTQNQFALLGLSDTANAVLMLRSTVSRPAWPGTGATSSSRRPTRVDRATRASPRRTSSST